MEGQGVVAFELALQLSLETAVAVQPGDFIFVLVGHEFKEVAGHGLRQGLAVRRHLPFPA